MHNTIETVFKIDIFVIVLKDDLVLYLFEQHFTFLYV